MLTSFDVIVQSVRQITDSPPIWGKGPLRSHARWFAQRCIDCSLVLLAAHSRSLLQWLRTSQRGCSATASADLAAEQLRLHARLAVGRAAGDPKSTSRDAPSSANRRGRRTSCDGRETLTGRQEATADSPPASFPCADHADMSASVPPLSPWFNKASTESSTEQPTSPLSSVLQQGEEHRRARMQQQSTAPPQRGASPADSSRAGSPDAGESGDPSTFAPLPAAASALPPGSGLAPSHSFDPFPMLNTPTAASASYPPSAAQQQYTASHAAAAEGSAETPSDILHYHQSFHAARAQLLAQSLAAVGLVRRAWSKLVILSRDAQERQKFARATGDKGPATGGARHSTLAASYMSMVAQQQEQQQQQVAQQQAAQAQMETPMEETEEASEEEGEQGQDETVGASRGATPSSRATTARSVTPSSSSTRAPGLSPSSAAPRLSSMAASEMERAVQNAHQNKLAKEALETAAKKRAEEDQRQQALIRLEQQSLREKSAGDFDAVAGESAFIRLQQSSKDVPNEPLRVGIIGAGKIGAAIAEQILQQMCGLAPAAIAHSSGPAPQPPPPPAVPANASGLRLFISTRRPEHPSMLALLKRTTAGGSNSNGVPNLSSATRGNSQLPGGGSSDGHASVGGPLLTVYWDNARLVTECNVVLVCVLPHQMQLLASNLRAISPQNKPRSQLFFAITSSLSRQALLTHLGVDVALAQSSVVLPHLLLKGSPGALDLLSRFQSTLLSSATQALSAQASFASLLGAETVARVVKGGSRELEQEVAPGFVDAPPVTTPQMHPSESKYQPKARAPQASSIAGTSSRPTSSASSSSSSVRFSQTPSSLSQSSAALASRSTASGVGLTPALFPSTVASASLPKLQDLRQRDSVTQARLAAQAAVGKVAPSERAPVPVTSKENGRGQHKIDVNPNLALPAHVKLPESAAPRDQFSPAKRRQVFHDEI